MKTFQNFIVTSKKIDRRFEKCLNKLSSTEILVFIY